LKYNAIAQSTQNENSVFRAKGFLLTTNNMKKKTTKRRKKKTYTKPKTRIYTEKPEDDGEAALSWMTMNELNSPKKVTKMWLGLEPNKYDPRVAPTLRWRGMSGDEELLSVTPIAPEERRGRYKEYLAIWTRMMKRKKQIIKLEKDLKLKTITRPLMTNNLAEVPLLSNQAKGD
jgi:hypothetical protein